MLNDENGYTAEENLLSFEETSFEDLFLATSLEMANRT